MLNGENHSWPNLAFQTRLRSAGRRGGGGNVERRDWGSILRWPMAKLWSAGAMAPLWGAEKAASCRRQSKESRPRRDSVSRYCAGRKAELWSAGAMAPLWGAEKAASCRRQSKESRPRRDSVSRYCAGRLARGQRNLKLCKSADCGERAEACTPGAIGFQARSARCTMHRRLHDRAASPDAANPDRRTIRPGGPGAATAGTASSPTSLSSRSGSSG
jgi:hypothetical protein